MHAFKLRVVLLVLGFLSRPSTAFQGPKKVGCPVSLGKACFHLVPQTLTEIAALFGADSTRALGTLISLLLVAGTLVFLLRKRTAAIVDKFIAWTIRTGAASSLLVILLLAFVIWRPRIFIFITVIVGIAHLFSIPLWPGSAPARPTRGQVQSRFKAPACGQTKFPVATCGMTIG
ncbi:hypothetical protein DFH07DRAFT_848691 [Mycena maculata]|uniref:Uncharacterized protein n=1 Tax=Mycena maculata TaxID=230809 RepID=A0AAD7HXE5_9AGAR|nr:hypothetical protein DFH07DRAFT_848691 [Mycena maculata]